MSDPSYFNADSRWCTAQDYIHSYVLAYGDVRRYLQKGLEIAVTDPATAGKTSPVITWTASKAAFVELLYALQSSGVFNHGVSDIKQLATRFERHFIISLGNYYHVFQEIRIRKKLTSFLDGLKEKLIRRMDDADEQNS